MASRFKTAPVPSGEVARYTSDPYNLSSIYMFGSSSPFTGQGNTIVRPNDDLLIQKGGNRALSVYQRLFYDEQVQACYAKLLQEVTSRPWYVQEYSSKPGDIAVRDFVAEILEEMNVDDLMKGLGEALLVGFAVGEVMWKKTKRGVIPYDVRLRDQRRFVFQEKEDAQTGFTMRCLTFNRMFEGVELPQRKFIVNRYWLTHNGDPYGAALGRVLYPLVKFRRRAIESYVLYGDRYATPTAVAKAPLSASTRELDTLYDHLSNLSQETALILPEGYEMEFVNPTGHPDVFKNLIDYIDKEINMLLCGENEAGQAEAGSRASSQVANTVRVVKASELSEMLCQTLNQSLVRWIVDLNFGTDVATPTLTREFRIEESTLTMPDVSLLIQSGYTPKKEWIERHFRVELEDKADSSEEAGGNTTYDPEQDQDLFGSIFGNEASGELPPAEGGGVATEQEAASNLPAEEPAATTPPENDQKNIGAPTDDDINTLLDEQPEESFFDDENDEELDPFDEILGDEDQPKKPFGNEQITEDEAVRLSADEG
jgi:hypothetical protein